MEKAKAAVSDFMGKAGHHDTTVHENVAPAVTHQTVKPEKHEKVTTAIDKEIHQDHYHTSVQPVQDRETLAEKHHHNLVGVEHRQFDHGNDRDVKARLEREAAQFKDTTETASTRETRSAAPQVGGEHIHHHVHETIQPVVHKETIQPHVVHTTVPIHEVHHNAATHHSTSALPAVSMADFKRQGGSLTGREERYDGFEGEPRSIGGAGGALGGSHSITGDRGVGTSATHHGHHDRHTGEGVGSGLTGSHSGSGLTGSNTHRTSGEALGSGVTGGSHGHDRIGERGVGGTHIDRANEGVMGTGNHHNTDSGLTGTGTNHSTAGKAVNLAGGAVGSHGTGTHGTGTHGTGTHSPGTHSPGTHGTGTHGTSTHGINTHEEPAKPSLLQRLNPLADTDGDGKKGIMD